MVGAKAIESASKSKATPWIIGGVALVGVGLTIYVVVKVLEVLQIKDTHKEKKDSRNSERLTTDQAFDPIHSRNKPSKVTISSSKASQLARDIMLSSGYYTAGSNGKILPSYTNDDEAKLYGAIRNAGTTYNLSKVADVMYKKYNTDLLEHMRDFLNDSEMAKVKKIVDNYKS